MNLHALKAEDENEKNTIDQEREMRLQRRNAILKTIDREVEVQKTKKEQTGKLDDLMNKL